MGIGQGAGSHYLTHGPIFDRYEEMRYRLPKAGTGGACSPARDLSDIADLYDTFLLDAFGVLNVGEMAIDGAPERVAELQAAGKRVFVVSNAAGPPHQMLIEKYARLGFDFAADDVITSRKTLLEALEGDTRHWGVMVDPHFGSEELEALSFEVMEDDPDVYEAADGFLLIGSAVWTEARHTRLEAALKARPRDVYVGNPDIAAPRENGPSREPGYWAHRIADATGVEPVFFGKPFSNIYHLVFARLGQAAKARTVMVGDSLHTDVLGGQVAGVATALVTSHGLLRAADPLAAIADSRLRPDHVLVTT